MKFDFFLKNLPKIEKIKVNSTKAQLEFSPENRPEFSKTFKTEKTREAAVMPIISPINDEAYLTLIIRTTYKGAHSGQVAFAGGKWETTDQSLLDTAHREVEEEIGIEKAKLNYIRDLTSLYVPVSDFRVYPFLAYANELLVFTPQITEVAKVINIPINELLTGNLKKTVDMATTNTTNMKVPAFVYGDYVIWGATAMILNELKQVIVKSME